MVALFILFFLNFIILLGMQND